MKLDSKKANAIITTTEGILYLIKNAESASINLNDIKSAIYSNGNHLMHQSEPLDKDLNRTYWFIRTNNSIEPETVWMDVTNDALQEVVTIIEMEEA